jgi:hypothetical protein
MSDFDANDGLARLPGAAPGPRLLPADAVAATARHLDLVLLAIATPVALALGAPLLGYAIGAGVWVLQHVLAHTGRYWISKTVAPGRQLGVNLFEAFARIWLLAGGIVVAGVAGSRADGLTCALVVFCAYSVAFAMRLLDGRPQGATER